MGIIYDTDSVSTKSNTSADFYKMNSVRNYIVHYGNFLFLRFITINDKASALEKNQAKEGIPIASRKCDFWRQIAKYQQRIPELIVKEQELRKQWDVHN